MYRCQMACLLYLKDLGGRWWL